MKLELKKSYEDVIARFEEHSKLNENITLMKADAEKYGRQVEEIEQMPYTEITEEIVVKLTTIRMRLDLIPNALAFAGKQLSRAGHEAYKALEICLQRLDIVFDDCAKKTAERLENALIKQGVSADEANKIIKNSDPIQQIRGLSSAARSFNFYQFQSIEDGWRICAETRAKLDPFVKEALNDKPNFEQFLSAE